jgi:hypothetical protein
MIKANSTDSNSISLELKNRGGEKIVIKREEITQSQNAQKGSDFVWLSF